jgi:hypothetical protein
MRQPSQTEAERHHATLLAVVGCSVDCFHLTSNVSNKKQVCVSHD